jgi:predicted DNA-binding ribbon-helix-helix protein
MSRFRGKDMTTMPPPSNDETPGPPANCLVSRNVKIHAHRTSIRLEPEMWEALYEVAGLESCSIHDVCGAVHDVKPKDASFTGALRVFLMQYYRSSARSGHQVGLVQQRLDAAREKLRRRQRG